MRREDILNLTRAVPFRPFRVFVSNGETFDIRHPEMIMATTGAVHLGFPSPGSPADVVDQVRIVSLYHIQKIEQLPTPAAPAGVTGAE